MKQLLKQYNSLQEEIKDLERDIKHLEKQEPKREIDKVTGSNDEFPYQSRSFTIEGYNIQETDRLRTRRNILKERKNKCEEFKIEIEKFINTIPDSKTRRVFQYRYIYGLSWQAIARRIGRHDESYPRKIVHDKYLEGLK